MQTDIVLSFIAGKLISIFFTFAADDYESMAAAFREKYGPPHKVSHEVLSTALGARYQNETLRWRTTTGELEIDHYGSQVTDGWASITSPSGLRALKEREAKKRKQAKKDL